MEDKVKLTEQELLQVTGGNNTTLKEECGAHKRKACKDDSRCKWHGISTMDCKEYKVTEYACRPADE